MVGCIIGRAGSKISEIRKTSGARISIAKVRCHGFTRLTF
jgi:heterogeneous nuclear rnp K-like protein